MLSDIYINRIPELARLLEMAVQLLANLGKRQGRDWYQPARSARAEGSDGRVTNSSTATSAFSQ